jgi:uncharacterized protein YciI
VATFHVVIHRSGPDYDLSLPLEQQSGWDEHAAFMDGLVADGFVVLGGPVGHGDGEATLIVVDADSEETVRARFAEDPWANHLLTVESVRPWSVWLRGPAFARPPAAA